MTKPIIKMLANVKKIFLFFPVQNTDLSDEDSLYGC